MTTIVPHGFRYRAADFTNNRPLCFLSTLCGLRDGALGVGMILGIDHIEKTLLYMNFDQIWPGVSPALIGAFLVFFGIWTMVFAIKDRTKLTRIGLRFQAFVWLFIAIIYALNEHWVLTVYLAGFMSIVSGYLAFYYKYAPLWRNQKRAFRDQWIAEHDHLTHITDRVRLDRKEAGG